MDIQAAKKRCEAATEGYWMAELADDLSMVIFVEETEGIILSDGAYLSEEDAEFIAYAHEDLPAALEALEKARSLAKILGRSLTECSAPKQDVGGLIRNRRTLALLRLQKWGESE